MDWKRIFSLEQWRADIRLTKKHWPHDPGRKNDATFYQHVYDALCETCKHNVEAPAAEVIAAERRHFIRLLVILFGIPGTLLVIGLIQALVQALSR